MTPRTEARATTDSALAGPWRARRRLALPLLLAALAGAPGQGDAASVSDWREDLAEIGRQLRARHPDPFARCGHLTFARELARLVEEVPRLGEEQRVARSMRLVAMVGDGHTQLEPARADFGRWYPVRLYEFDDGLFVTAAHESVAELAGAQLLEVAGRPARQAADDARALFGADNELGAREALFALSSPPLMQGLGYADAAGRVRIKVRLVGGEVLERWLVPHVSDDPRYPPRDSSFEWRFQAEMGGPPLGGPDRWISAYRGLRYLSFRTPDRARPPRLVDRRYFTALPLPAQDAFYIQSNSVGPTFADEFRDALAQVDQRRPRRLIIDLRYNFGGDGSLVPELARELARRHEAPPWRELYVITGRRTFSAGIMALAAVLRSAEVTVVGEPAGAPLNSFGDPVEIPLPRTGLRLQISTVAHQIGEPGDGAAHTPVDVVAGMTAADYAAGRDPALDPILAGEEMRGLAVIATLDGGAAARRAHERRRERFARLSWWRPPAELELRQAMLRLRRLGRQEDALETARLATELHPDRWNAWYNLGSLELELGRRREGLASWRRVLELDPENPNAPAIHKALAEPPGGP
jgi:hypothetical protein